MSPDLAIPASPAALRNEGSGFLPLTAKAASFSGIGYARRNGVTLCMGQYQGGFALCTVTGAEILDQNFQRVSPIAIQDPTPAWVRYSLPGSSVGTLQRKLRTEDVTHTIVTPNVDITLMRVGQSDAYLAPITLVPETAGPLSRRALVSGAPEVKARLGEEGSAILSTPSGVEDSRCGLGYPAKLQLRFVKRDGSGLTDADPNGPYPEPGLKQETAIGAKGENYAEIVKLEIEAVDPHDPATLCAHCTAEVGIKESPNTRYDAATRVFYDGTNGSTKLESNGKINGSFVNLEGGRKTVELKAVLDVRKNSSHSVTPSAVVTGSPAYEGLGGAQLIAKGMNKILTTDGSTQYVSHWVDERTYTRRRGQALTPSDVDQYWVAFGGPNDPGGGRDWLEKKIKDFYADWTGDSEIEMGMSRVESVVDTNDPVSKNVVVTEPYGRANGLTTTVRMTWTLWTAGTRRPATSGEIQNTNFDEAGFLVNLAPAGDTAQDILLRKDNFMQTAIHEARHAWQYTLADTSGGSYPDADVDVMFAEPPLSAQCLKDARLSVSSGDGGNPEYDSLAEKLFDYSVWGQDAYDESPTPTITAPKEADAIRASARLVGLSTLVGCSTYSLSEITRFGPELRVQASWNKRGGTLPYEGAAVRFDIVPGAGGTTGNMALSEFKYDEAAGTVAPDLRPLEQWPPSYPASASVWQVIRQAQPLGISRNRYTSRAKTAAEARILLLPPATGQATATRVKATLILPPECGTTTSIPKIIDVP